MALETTAAASVETGGVVVPVGHLLIAAAVVGGIYWLLKSKK